MKNNQLIGILVAILFVTTGVAGFLLMRYTSTVRARRQIAPQLVFAHNEEGVFNALAADAVEYGKRNHDIDPILRVFIVNFPPGANTPAPAGKKPGTR